MDKNSAIGFGLLMVLLIVYLFINQNDKTNENNKEANKTEQISTDTLTQKTNTISDSVATITNKDAAEIIQSDIAIESATLENEDVVINFTNQGAYPTQIELKQYKTFDKKDLILFKGDKNYFDFKYNQAGVAQSTRDKIFKTVKSADGKSIQFSTGDSTNGFTIEYKIADKGYMMDMKVQPNSADKNQNIALNWGGQSLHTEQDKYNEKQYTQVVYSLTKDGYDDYTISEQKSEDFEKASLNWLGFKQHFFNTTLVSLDNSILSANVVSSPVDDSLEELVSNFNATVQLQAKNELNFQYYTGPNDYDLLKTYDKGLEEIVPLSYGIFGFVKYINKWLIIPIFKGLSSIFSNYGLVIIFLTLIVRLIMSPLTYKSYVSGAKMKALKPELDELKEKHKDRDGNLDQQKYGVEQMQLYRQAGVNPLGGCLPALVQMPIFFALFSYFPHAIDLRQKSFLWAKDLSSYDVIVNLPFDVPFYGSHVSLFTILFCVTSLLLALYSMSTTSMDNGNPMLKYMPFIMPVMFLGLFNKFAAALTLYYFISNLVTLGIQFVIRQWIIDPDKIRAKILAKKNEPPKESKFMKRMKEMQEQNIDRAKTRSQRRK